MFVAKVQMSWQNARIWWYYHFNSISIIVYYEKISIAHNVKDLLKIKLDKEKLK